MITQEQNDTLTQTNKGTLMGDLFRRYWIPALHDWELPEPDCAPVRVKLLGESLIAFRDTQNRIGLNRRESVRIGLPPLGLKVRKPFVPERSLHHRRRALDPHQANFRLGLRAGSADDSNHLVDVSQRQQQALDRVFSALVFCQ